MKTAVDQRFPSKKLIYIDQICSLRIILEQTKELGKTSVLTL